MQHGNINRGMVMKGKGHIPRGGPRPRFPWIERSTLNQRTLTTGFPSPPLQLQGIGGRGIKSYRNSNFRGGNVYRNRGRGGNW